MNRRNFLKNALSLLALAPLAGLHSKLNAATATLTSADSEKAAPVTSPEAQVSRRRFKQTRMMLPLIAFGCMRFPMKGDSVDIETTQKLIDRAMACGVNYFDTAWPYHSGKSESVVAATLKKYPRDSYFIADKLPIWEIKSEADLERIFNEQLKRCQTPYFDFYMVHSLSAQRWEICKKFKVFDFLQKLKNAGKIKNIGFSFHDEPPVLQTILTAHPWDFVQLQLNYLDWTLIKGKEMYEMTVKANIPVIVMEPLRGGNLATLNPAALQVLKNENPKVSAASWAFRYVATLPNVATILSGMSCMEHLNDNINTFTPFVPLQDMDQRVLDLAVLAYKKSGVVPCTGCQYCMPCEEGVDIPRIFGLYNQYKATGVWWQFQMAMNGMKKSERPEACVTCKLCMKHCPQKINIPAELKKIAKEFKEKS